MTPDERTLLRTLAQCVLRLPEPLSTNDILDLRSLLEKTDPEADKAATCSKCGEALGSAPYVEICIGDSGPTHIHSHC